MNKNIVMNKFNPDNIVADPHESGISFFGNVVDILMKKNDE